MMMVKHLQVRKSCSRLHTVKRGNFRTKRINIVIILIDIQIFKSSFMFVSLFHFYLKPVLRINNNSEERSEAVHGLGMRASNKSN